MDVSENSGFSPQIIHFNRVFHYKPSILGYHYFWKHLYGYPGGVFFNDDGYILEKPWGIIKAESPM